MKRKTSPAKTSLLAVLVLVVGMPMSAPAGAQVSPGDTVHESLGKTIDGEELLVSSYRGKVVVATFWASWCGPCRKELPMLEGMQKVIGPEKIKVIAISIEPSDVFRKLGKAARSLSLTFTHDSSGAISKAYGRKGVPHLVVLDKEGRLLRTFIGYSEKQVDAVIEEVQEALQQQ
jgi:thiol-disulfide isomerase/thioredoxin